MVNKVVINRTETPMEKANNVTPGYNIIEINILQIRQRIETRKESIVKFKTSRGLDKAILFANIRGQ